MSETAAAGLPRIAEKGNENIDTSNNQTGMRMPSFMTRTLDSGLQSPLLNSRKQSTLIRMAQGSADPIGSLLRSKLLDEGKSEDGGFDVMKIREGRAFDTNYRPKVIRKTPF